jgi:purine nucleoside permease
LIAGIAGVNPNEGTLADVAFAKYAVQIGLQYEFDAREMPAGWNTGYSPLGSDHPEKYPTATYGTEVFELNTNLRDIAMGFTSGVKLNDSADSVAYRAHYNLNTAAKKSDKFKEAIKKPSVRKGDVVTSDQYFSGTLLGESFVNTTRLFTNGSGTYCMTAQEDNATLEALLRGAARKVLDFSRIIVMRAAADFDRPYPGLPSYDNLFVVTQGAFNPSLLNLYIAGTPVVKGILKEWTTRFQAGIKPSNYVGDIFGTLGGKPDFGPYRVGDNPVQERELPAKTVAGNPRGKGKSGYHVALKAQGLK